MLVISPKSKNGYASTIEYKNGHASLVKTVSEIFGIKQINVAADPATPDLSDMLMGGL
jgi:hypothetical protein